MNLKLLSETMRGFSDSAGDHHWQAHLAIEQLIAVTAQVEQLRNEFENQEADADPYGKIAQILAATPAQCLAEIQADAYWKGYVAGGDDFRSRINIPFEVVTKKLTS